MKKISRGTVLTKLTKFIAREDFLLEISFRQIGDRVSWICHSCHNLGRVYGLFHT